MKLVKFNTGMLGALQPEGAVIDLNHAYASLLAKQGEPRPQAKADAAVPTDLLAFILEGDAGLTKAAEAVKHVQSGAAAGPRGEKLHYKPEEATLHAPLPGPGTKIAMAGANFYDHSVDAYKMLRGDTTTVEELKQRVADGKYPPWGFWKMNSCVVGPGAQVPYPARTQRMDYEVELAAVLGKGGKDIPEEDAMDYIYGYTIVNDLSIRDSPRTPGPNGLFYAKNYEGSAPMGPCIVTKDEVPDPYKLAMRQWVNDELRQDGSMESIIRGYAWWISYLTRDLPFNPGDMICGGTCSGTAMDQTPVIEGVTDPRLFLKPGDRLKAWIEGVGTLETRIVSKE